jgi:hypothetical protein
MRKKSILYLLLGLLAISCSSNPEISLQVTNPLKQERSDAVILISRSEISDWTTIPDDLLPVLKDIQGDFIPCQANDVDGDGNWDELFALTDMEAEAQQRISVEFISQEDYPVFPARTNLHLGDARDNYKKLDQAQRLEGVSYHNYADLTGAAFQMEGPAWENDLVGFRNYMDQRNGMDIFGKTTSAMVLDNVGKEGEPSYHEPGDWGMDVLKVGTSLGAGGIGYMYKDSIYRVGDNGSGNYEVVFRGSQSSRFKLNYSDWKVDDQVLEVEHQIGIAAGSRFYQGMVTYTGTEEAMKLVVGIVNMKSEQLHVLELDEQYTGLYTMDHQAEDGSLLTMALVVPTSYLIQTAETRDEGDGVIQTYYALLDASPGEPISYRFYSLWETEDQRWSSAEEIESYFKNEALRWTQSVVYAN